MTQDDINLGPPEDDDRIRPPTPLVTVMRIGLLTLIGGAIVGAGGALLISALDAGSRPELAAVEVVPEPTPEAVMAASETPGAQLLEAQAAVVALEDQLAQKEQQLAEIAAAAGVPSDQLASTDLALEVEKMRGNLHAARKFRDGLKVELKEALASVERQTELTSIARSEASSWRKTNLRSQWSAFTATAKTELCDHGTRKAVDNCHGEVDAFFTEAQFARYASCVEGGGATPVLYSTTKGNSAPAAAEPLATTGFWAPKDWYVLYCDPNLPERADAGAEQVATVE